MPISNTTGQCSLCSVAIQAFEYVGAGCQAVAGTLKSGANYRVGDLVKWNTATKDWDPILIGDTLTSASSVGVIKSLRQFSNGQTFNQVNADGTATSADFAHAQIWASGSETRIRCSETFLKNGSTRVAFDPATHTSLAAQLKIIRESSPDGLDSVDYFTWR
jgi:hypothetical protein